MKSTYVTTSSSTYLLWARVPIVSVMACALTAPSHYIIHYWFLIKVPKIRMVSAPPCHNTLDTVENYILEMTLTFNKELTHRGQVTFICFSKLCFICPDNGSSPIRHKPLSGSSLIGSSLIRPIGTHFSEFRIKMKQYSFKKMSLKRSSAKWRPFCPVPKVWRTMGGLASILRTTSSGMARENSGGGCNKQITENGHND